MSPALFRFGAAVFVFFMTLVGVFSSLLDVGICTSSVWAYIEMHLS